MSPTYSQSLTTFVSGTLDERRPEIINNVWTSTDMLAWVSAHRKPQQGGKKVFSNLEYGKSTSIVKGLGRGGKIPLVQDEIITQCWYDWCSYGGGVIRYRDDDLENSGKYEVFNLTEAYINNMINTFKETLEQDVIGTEATGTSQFCGLQALVEDLDGSAADTTPPASTKTIGNLSRATYPWFVNWGRNMTGKDPSLWLTYYMREQVNNVRTWTGKDPEAILTHYVARDLYEDEVQETLRTMDVQLGDIGIRTVEWKGIPFICSPYMTQTRMYFMGANSVELIYEPRMWFKATDWKEPTQQPFDYAKQYVVKGQFTIKHPRGCSVLYNINN